MRTKEGMVADDSGGHLLYRNSPMALDCTVHPVLVILYYKLVERNTKSETRLGIQSRKGIQLPTLRFFEAEKDPKNGRWG
jgi:hypothetical protein